MKAFLSAVVLSFCFEVLSSSVSRAAPILYDGFAATDYSPGQQLVDGVGGGAPLEAFAEPWDDRKNSADNADLIVEAGLNFTHPATGAELATRDHALQSVTQTLDSSENLRDLTDLALSDGSELWFSLLLRKTGTSGQIDDAGFFQLQPLSGDGIAIGDFAFSDKLSILRLGEEATIAETNIEVATGTTYFLVARIAARAGASDSADFFVNPSPGIIPALAADATLTNFDIGGIDAFQLSAFNQLAGASYVFDEIRFGTTFADVALIVPEPSGAALLTFAGVAYLARRRCSRNWATTALRRS